MQAYWTLTRRELGSYFLSLTGYLIIAGAMFLLGFSFVVLLVKLRQDPTPMPLTEVFYVTQFFWLILLLSIPIITMRLFALEKFTGTFETLMTTPVSDLQVVLAKFTAAFVFYMVMWLPLLGCLVVVGHYTSEPAALNPGTLAGTFIGIALLGCMFIGFGCFASALTRSQVLAAMITLGFGATLFLLSVLAEQFPASGAWHAELLSVFALFDHMRDFSRGILDSRPVVLYLSLASFFLFLTLRVIESRRWR